MVPCKRLKDGMIIYYIDFEYHLAHRMVLHIHIHTSVCVCVCVC
jgi:hypothetical protein